MAEFKKDERVTEDTDSKTTVLSNTVVKDDEGVSNDLAVITKCKKGKDSDNSGDDDDNDVDNDKKEEKEESSDNDNDDDYMTDNKNINNDDDDKNNANSSDDDDDDDDDEEDNDDDDDNDNTNISNNESDDNDDDDENDSVNTSNECNDDDKHDDNYNDDKGDDIIINNNDSSNGVNNIKDTTKNIKKMMNDNDYKNNNNDDNNNNIGKKRKYEEIRETIDDDNEYKPDQKKHKPIADKASNQKIDTCIKHPLNGENITQKDMMDYFKKNNKNKLIPKKIPSRILNKIHGQIKTLFEKHFKEILTPLCLNKYRKEYMRICCKPENIRNETIFRKEIYKFVLSYEKDLKGRIGKQYDIILYENTNYFTKRLVCFAFPRNKVIEILSNLINGYIINTKCEKHMKIILRNITAKVKV